MASLPVRCRGGAQDLARARYCDGACGRPGELDPDGGTAHLEVIALNYYSQDHNCEFSGKVMSADVFLKALSPSRKTSTYCRYPRSAVKSEQPASTQ